MSSCSLTYCVLGPADLFPWSPCLLKLVSECHNLCRSSSTPPVNPNPIPSQLTLLITVSESMCGLAWGDWPWVLMDEWSIMYPGHWEQLRLPTQFIHEEAANLMSGVLFWGLYSEITSQKSLRSYSKRKGRSQYLWGFVAKTKENKTTHLAKHQKITASQKADISS